jgi:hypothetical protein
VTDSGPSASSLCRHAHGLAATRGRKRLPLVIELEPAERRALRDLHLLIVHRHVSTTRLHCCVRRDREGDRCGALTACRSAEGNPCHVRIRGPRAFTVDADRQRAATTVRTRRLEIRRGGQRASRRRRWRGDTHARVRPAGMQAQDARADDEDSFYERSASTPAHVAVTPRVFWKRTFLRHARRHLPNAGPTLVR